ncbi:adenosine deaminase [Phaeobacter gallaeciensis]|uniref:Adenosine deaminase n=2 Tax=Roseobacteraceae TaxID=2854170 RepID=A0A366WJH8_9RHOB|nr:MULTISPECIES: adenosine deaminase [Roseobacteraceae]MBT3143724.1 adenosine deaminase [Falsiruegeria litorea]MBT8167994.1 adenosine deaminase [Falsiruegeria litorea]RBW49516.1 adenosine deaminase [Phaeobacter gallaeciensis]
MTVADLPKVELHLHHEGAAPPAFIRQLAHEKRVDLSGIFTSDGAYDFRDFTHFLSVYEAASTVLTGPEEFRRLTIAILEESAANGVVYSETFLSPDFCGGGDLHAWRDYLAAIQDAAGEAEAKHGIVLRGVVTCVRHFGPDKAKAAALCAAETTGDWVVGFGMGGNEGVGKQGDFGWSFDCAREAGLRLTTHAGEFAGPDSVRDAVRILGVERIGHGVRAIEDPDLVHELADRGTTLEVCPGSNIVLGLYPNFAAHPIARLRDAGVKVTVSTDDPPFFHTTMRREYEMLHEAFGWAKEDFAALNATALDAAFCDGNTRDRVKKKLETT